MYNCDEKDIIKLDADFNEDFDSILIDLISNYKRIYFTNQKGFGIKSIRSNSKFNKSVDILPQYLTHIKFGYSFNQKVENLPFNLEWLEFGYNFNQNVNMLPEGITYLVFGYSFNQPVFDLPNGLEYISFGVKFNYPIDSLPNSIHYIHIGFINDQENSNNKICSEFYHNVYNLPTKLNNIVISSYCRKCPAKYPIKSDFIYQLNESVKNKRLNHKN